MIDTIREIVNNRYVDTAISLAVTVGVFIYLNMRDRNDKTR